MKPKEIAILAVFFASLIALLAVTAPHDGIGIVVHIEQLIGGDR